MAKKKVLVTGASGLIGGIGIAVKSADESIRVTGVQSRATPAMYEAFRAGKLVQCAVVPTLADGLAGQVDEVSFERARQVVDEMVLVEERSIPAAIRALYHEGVTGEGSAAVSVAAVLEQVITVDGPTVVVITGGNIDAERFAAILSSE